MNLARVALAAVGSLALGACSSGYVVHTTNGGFGTVAGGSSAAGTSGGTGTTGGVAASSSGGTTGTGTSNAASTSGASSGSSSAGTTGGTTAALPPNSCVQAGSGVSAPLGGSCELGNDGLGTCVGEGFYCSIDPDAGLCATVGYVSGYPFAVSGGDELFDVDAGQPVFPGLCAAASGSLGLGAECTTVDPNDAFGACAAGAFCLGTCEAACDVRFPVACGDGLGQTCRSAQVVGLGGTNAAPQYPQGVCGLCQSSGLQCALASECCQSGPGVVCSGARTSPLLDGGFTYGTCGLCACHGDAVACPCAVNADCCNAGDVCIGGACSDCVLSGAGGSAGTCASSTECCASGSGGTACVEGTCQACILSGASCQIDQDCCSNLCDELSGLCN